ncbi:MAG: adaptor protein MecA [bacterium]|nr:adaptor protein MecA [bacterium]
MKIERVSSDKFRVKISHDELREMNVNPEMFFSDGKALNALIVKVLREIHEKTDFEPFSGSMTMEASPDSEGMSIILSKGPGITELGSDKELRDIARMLKKLGEGMSDKEHFGQDGVISGGIIHLPNEFRKTGTHRKHRKIRSVKAVKGKSRELLQTFVFGSFDDMCHAMRRLSVRTTEISELYKLDGKYMVLVPVITNVLDDLAILMEFASEIKRGMAYEYVREHGECIAQGAALSDMCGRIGELI